MPRLPFFTWGFSALCSAALCAATFAAPPVPSISIQSTSGMAPFTVHVHGLNSALGNGTKLTARYEWDFGDPGGDYNTLVGWNAAHTYTQPGAYLLTLRIVNESGAQATATAAVTVTADTRTKIYVSPDGSDSNNGLTPGTPIKTFAKAATMLGNNKTILFRRSATYDTSASMNISQQNVVIGAWGSGSIPVVRFTANVTWTAIFNVASSAKDVTIDSIYHDSLFTPNNQIVRGVHPKGQNVTIRHCHFQKVGYAISAYDGGVVGLYTMNNTAGVVGAYYVWGEGSDHVHLGNTVAGSVDEHNIRLVANRVLIAHNDLTNTPKTTIWAMIGDHCYITGNTLHQGRVIAGPNYAVGNPSDRFRWLVFEDNEIQNEGMIVYAGAEDMAIRNNVVKFDGGLAFSIWGYYAPMNRTVKNIVLANNTAINNSSQQGRFVRIGNDAQNITVINNINCAPYLNTQMSGANVYSDDTNLNSHSFRNNLWATPATGSARHFIGGVGQSVAQWDSYSQTASENYRGYSPSDLDGQFAPQFNASLGEQAAGVDLDFHSSLRPSVGPIAVGAVETNPGGVIVLGDVNGDGVVNVNDLIVIVTTWGWCPSLCPGDLSGDGAVNAVDLLIVIQQWS